MSSKGWIKTYRQLQECWVWEQKPFSMGQAWIDLLLLANHSDKTILFNGSLITVKRGQYLTSTRKLADKWGWHRNTVSKFLGLLENDGMIDRESDNSRTLLTVIKYDVFQGCEDTDETPSVPQYVPPTVPQSDHGVYQGFSTNNNDKNYKNDKECNKNEGEYTHTHEEVDFDVIWRQTFEAYPKKSNHASAKTEWMNLLISVVEPNRKDVASMIWKAMQLYLKDYIEKNPDDTTYRYIPTFNKWLVEDLDYWMAEVRRRNEE